MCLFLTPHTDLPVSIYFVQYKSTRLRTGPMKWPQRWVTAYGVTLPAG